MKRLRMAAFAAVASMAFIPGCCCFDGQLLNRMGFGPRQGECCGECNNNCGSCCGSQIISEGPIMDNATGPYLPPPGGVIESGPQPRPIPQAQPMPAPVSTTKFK
jgi:hypothetical protein